MATTLVRPLQIDDVTAYDDTRASTAALETNSTLEGIVGAVISQIQNVTGNTNWYDAVTRTVETLNTDLADLETKKLLCTANLLTDVSVPSSQNWVVLSLASSETPSEVIAVALTQDGAVCSQLDTGDFGTNQVGTAFAEISGPDNLNPKNLVVIRDASTGQAIQSSGRDVFGLLQVEDGATDGGAFNDTTNQAQISFVRPNSTFDDLEAAAVADIENKTINYSYVFRTDLDSLGEDCNLANRNFTDLTASVDVTLDNAIDNQVGAATQGQNIEVRITDGFDWAFQDSVGADIFTVAAADGGSGGDTVVAAGATTQITSTTLDVDSGTNDFALGTAIDAAGGLTDTIFIGLGGTVNGETGAANTIQAGTAGTLTVQATQNTLTLQTVTSGALNVTSAGSIINTASSNITNSTGAGSSSAGGEFDVTTGVGDAGFSGGIIDMQTGDGGAGGSGSDGGDGGDATLNLGTGGVAAEGATPDAGGDGGSLAYTAGTGGAADGTDSGGLLGGDAGLGGNLAFTAGTGGAGSAGTVDAGQPADGGTVSLTGGAGGSGAGDSINSNGGDVVLTNGAVGTGGSGAAGTWGNVRVVSGADHLHEVLQLENTDHTGQLFVGDVNPDTVVTATAGSLYLRSNGSVYVNTNGATTWSELSTATGAVETLSDVVTNVGVTTGALMSDNFIWEVTDGDTLQFRTDTGDNNLLSLAAEVAGADTVTVGNTDSDTAVVVDTGTGGFTVNTTTTGVVDINGTNAVQINAAAASNFSVAGAGLTLETTTSGVLSLNAAGTFNLTGNGTSSEVTNTAGRLFLRTQTSGDITLASAEGLDIDAADEITINSGAAADASANDIQVAAGTSSGAGNDGASLFLSAGGSGAGGVPGTVFLRTGASNVDSDDPVFTVTNQGTNGHAFEVFARDVAADPDTVVSAPAGSLLVNVNAATTPELWFNDTTGTGDGTDWVRVATMDDIATVDTLSEVVTNQAGTAFVSGTFTTKWGIEDGQAVQFTDDGGQVLLGISSAADGVVSNVATFDVNATGLISLDSTAGAVSLDAAAASNFTTTAGSLSLVGAAGVIIDGGTSDITNSTDASATAATGDFTIQTGNVTAGAFNAGDFAVQLGDAFTGSAGGYSFAAGDATSAGGTGGGMAVSLGSATTGDGGGYTLTTGGTSASGGSAGDYTISSGSGTDYSGSYAAQFASYKIQTDSDAVNTGTIIYESNKHLFGQGDGTTAVEDGDTYLTLNHGWASTTATTGGTVVVDDQGTHGATTIATGGVESSTTNSGVNPRINVAAAGTFAVGDFVQLSNMGLDQNEGIFEIDAISGTTPAIFTLRGVGTGGEPTHEWSARELTDDTTVTGAVTHVNLCIMRCKAGVWEVANTDTADDITWNTLSTGSSGLGSAWDAHDGTTGNLDTAFLGQIDDGITYTIESATGNHDFLAFTAAAAGDSITLGADDGGTGSVAVTSGSGGVSVTGGVTGTVSVTGGVGSSSVGATADLTGGAGDGNFAGGTAGITGGAGGTGGTAGIGGTAFVVAGAAGVASGAAGGDISIQSTAGDGAGVDGQISIGTDSGSVSTIRIGIDAGGTEQATNLNLGATTSLTAVSQGTITATSTGLFSVTAGASYDVDVTGNYTMDASGTFSIDGVGISNITTDAGRLTLATTTSGDIIVDSVEGLDVDANEEVSINSAQGGATDASTFNVTITGGASTGAGNQGASIARNTGAGGAAVASTAGGVGGDATTVAAAGGLAFTGTTGTQALGGNGGGVTSTAGVGGAGQGNDVGGTDSPGNAGDGGDNRIIAGAGGAGDTGTTLGADSGDGGNVYATAGAAGAGAGDGGNGDGGNVYLQATPASTTGSGAAGADGIVTIQTTTSVESTSILQLDRGGTNGVVIDVKVGSADPESTIIGNAGDAYFRDGTVNGMYLKTSGDGTSSGWERVAVASEALTRTTTAVTVNTSIAAGVDVTTSNTDAVIGDLPDTSGVTFSTGVVVFVNGVRMLNHDGTSSHDVEQGTSPASGDLNFPSLALRDGDVIQVEVWDTAS